LFFKVVQNVYVSWIFLGGLCLSQNNKVGGYPVGVVVVAFCRTNVELGCGFIPQYSACRTL